MPRTQTSHWNRDNYIELYKGKNVIRIAIHTYIYFKCLFLFISFLLNTIKIVLKTSLKCIVLGYCEVFLFAFSNNRFASVQAIVIECQSTLLSVSIIVPIAYNLTKSR